MSNFEAGGKEAGMVAGRKLGSNLSYLIIVY